MCPSSADPIDVVRFTLPAGPGSYRLRYHARGMDAANDLDSDIPLDFFLLQIWPEPTSDPTLLKITSNKARRYRAKR